MKKIVAMLLALCLMLAFAGCGSNEKPAETQAPTAAPETEAPVTEAAETEAPTTAPAETEAAVMTYDEYAAIEVEPNELVPVVLETYVQAHQSWWDNKITVYCQSPEGACFAYEMACSEEDAEKLVPGTKIRITGDKTVWAGEYEITNGTFEFVEGGDTYITESVDVTDLLGTEELIQHQNEKVLFKGMTVESIAYKNDEPGDDIYVTLTKGDVKVDFCVEMYLTGPDTDVYKAVGELKAGDVIDVEGFLYWYEGVNTHITAVTPAA